MSTEQILIAGGGIGGLAAALACARAGRGVHLMERAREFTEVGAGIQIGPNVVRLLQAWDLEPALLQVVALPQRLQVRNAHGGQILGELRLGEQARAQYGAPYATVHRADLHQVLLAAVREQAQVSLNLDAWLSSWVEQNGAVTVNLVDGSQVQGDALIGADGLWSRVRQILLGDLQPRVTGHLAYRAMVRQDSLPATVRSQDVTVWLGPRLHVVQYPVRRGEWLNVVAIVQGQAPGPLDDWDQAATAEALRQALAGTATPLQTLVQAIDHWRLWALCDRAPMAGPHQHARGRVALLGDAAHPMRPYMAQGAGMAIEDAACLQQALTPRGQPIDEQLAWYAQQRWARNARVQARSIRNGQIFHATGLVRWGRDVAIKLLGERLLDVPWLYGRDGAS